MKISKRIVFFIMTCLLFFSGSVVINAQTDKETLQRIEKELKEKEKQKSSVNKELEAIEKEINSINELVVSNNKTMAATEKRIANISKQIEEKIEEIIVLEDKILARKDIMKQRAVALQHDSKLSIYIEVLIEAESFGDLIDRASAVTTLFDADKDLLKAQEDDMKQLEKDKREIDKQQEKLLDEQNKLREQQQELAKNLEKKEESLKEVQNKLNKINSELSGAQQEKASIEGKIKAAQAFAAKEREAANQKSGQSNSNSQNSKPGIAIKGQELYVVATAYSPEESGTYTALGYNIQENPHMKLIAVDPAVIPLGSKVWVENYGTAIAGDTGGAIKGHKIDLLMPTRAEALQWGRRPVKIIILD